jgi:hypothetical protein
MLFPCATEAALCWEYRIVALEHHRGISDQTTILARHPPPVGCGSGSCRFGATFSIGCAGVLGRIRESNQVDRLTTATQAAMCAPQGRRAQDGEVGLNRLILVENQGLSWLKNPKSEGGSIPPASTKLAGDLRSSTPQAARRSF